MSRNKDLDYIFLSTRVRAMERGLLNRERLERMLDAPTDEEAAKVITECGYPELSELTAQAVEQALAQRQRETMEDLGSAVPDPRALDLFKLRVDYHNAKVLVKGEALGQHRDSLLQWGGRYQPEELADRFRREELRGCSDLLRQGIAQAREILGATGDPQQADFALDRCYFEELSALAAATGSAFLKGYAALLIDAANLRSAVRAARLGKGGEFLSQVLAPGGNVSVSALSAARGDELGNLFRMGDLKQAAAEGAARSAAGSGPLTEFERLCDDAITRYLQGGRMVSFGIEPIAGYLHARQAEGTAIRTILSGRMAGLDRETIRQRLRMSYA
ncbi:MAG TPA: V-type ATP synthase subunit C [Clostridiales bacterium]|nr:V-type ATP synthase subunit C [Clostridiales bacterium]